MGTGEPLRLITGKKPLSQSRLKGSTIRINDSRSQALKTCDKVFVISSGKLNTLLHLHIRPIDLIVFQGTLRNLISGTASRLYAFSVYPFRS